MIARVAAFEGMDFGEVERSTTDAESMVVPIFEGLAGYQGHLQLAAQNGKMLSIVLFDSVEHADAAEGVFDEEMPRKLGEIFETWAGRRISVDRYRVLGDSVQQMSASSSVTR
jgi:hypothetical protein